MQTSEHEWQERERRAREAPAGPVLAYDFDNRGWLRRSSESADSTAFALVIEPTTWQQCRRCGVSEGAAERFGWQDCRPTEGGERR